MVIDENVDILFSVKIMLESSLEYSIITVENNDNCIKLLKNGITPDAILY